MKMQNEEFVQENKIWCIGWSPVSALVCVYFLSFFAVFVLFAIYRDAACLLAGLGIAAAANLRYILVIAKKALLAGKDNTTLIAIFNLICTNIIGSLQRIIQPFFEKLSFKIKVMNRNLADLVFAVAHVVHICITIRLTPPDSAC